MILRRLSPLLLAALPLAGLALAPFGDGLKPPARQITPTAGIKPVLLDCLDPAKAPLWSVELPPADAPAGLFKLETVDGKNALTFQAGLLEPGRSTVRALLPGDGPSNGDVWAKNKGGYVTFLCKSTKPARLTFHLLMRGKSAGTCQAAFTAEPGGWQRVILTLPQFGIKSFARIAGIGFRAPDAPGAVVSVADFRIDAMPYSDDSWKSHRLSISLNGDWLFAADPGDQGVKDGWQGDAFADGSWKTLASGQSWQQQGISHYGFGWYRQRLFVPAAFAGTPLTLNLAPIPSDDDAWFNGTRIGGFSSEYKYNNWITRSYTVPPGLIRYGATNTLSLRIWGGDITFIGPNSGLVKGPLTADLDPYRLLAREPGGTAVPVELFDFSDARQGKAFDLVVPFPAELARENGTRLRYRLEDRQGNALVAGTATLQPGPDRTIQAVVPVDAAASRSVYLRGRFQLSLLVEDGEGLPLYAGLRQADQLLFLKRDQTPLPPLAAKQEETPYGRLTLVDEIDCALPQESDPHPYLQGSFDHAYDRVTPGSPVNISVRAILGRQTRECDQSGWFAYRVGRGKLTPRGTYLLRIEYPEDKPRFAPIEIQTGQNFMDVGWKNGVAADDVYDNWPLSRAWQWFDVIVPLDDQTVGTGGTGTAPAENGFWVYFMNKADTNRYYALYGGGPAVARIKLYALDPKADAPVIRKPEGLPRRVLAFDWERQPDHNPADLVAYAKLMGYSAISPVIVKWAFANYSDPLDGYMSVAIDDRDYWAKKDWKPGTGPAVSPLPGKKSQHVRYLEATRGSGVDYLPRIEWGGSYLLPREAWAVGANGEPAKPNRFAPWCANLLDGRTWDDLQTLMDHLVKPYARDNPQLAGVLWRIRCDRLPISYGKADLELFSKETGIPLPRGGEAQWAAWATGEGKTRYDDWWHARRAQFHKKLAALLQSYRSDLALYYFNWDFDKFGLIETDITAWAFLSGVVKPPPEGGQAAYRKERELRKTFTAEDYIDVLRTGNFGRASKGINRADYAIRPDHYKDARGIGIFAPVNYLCYADKPAYFDYFQTGDGLAVSHCVSYDEIGSRSINPKYEGNMIIPGGPAFSMALELLAVFHGDARTLTYTAYTYGRGFADAHRRFAQAFLALPAIPGAVADQGDPDVRVRLYPSPGGTYAGVAFKGYATKSLKLAVPAPKADATVLDLVTGRTVPSTFEGGQLRFTVETGPMELNAFLIR